MLELKQSGDGLGDGAREVKANAALMARRASSKLAGGDNRRFVGKGNKAPEGALEIRAARNPPPLRGVGVLGRDPVVVTTG